MLKKTKFFLIIFLVFTFALFSLSSIVFAKKSERKAYFATDVEIVRKGGDNFPGVTINARPSTPPGLADPINAEEAIVSGLLSPLSASATKYAIIVGISNYPVDAWDIYDYDADAQNMKTALMQNYGYEEDNIFLLRDLSATSNSIYNAIEEVKNLELEGDEVVFFYSGHGVKGKSDDGDKERWDEALLVHDGENLTYIWDGELRDLFSDFDTSRIAFIFDTCLAGGMNDLAGEGRIIIMSSKEDQNSSVYRDSDGLENGEGLFSHYFVNEGLLQGFGDVFNHLEDRSDLSLEEAFNYASGNLSIQTPVISDNFNNDLLLGF